MRNDLYLTSHPIAASAFLSHASSPFEKLIQIHSFSRLLSQAAPRSQERRLAATKAAIIRGLSHPMQESALITETDWRVVRACIWDCLSACAYDFLRDDGLAVMVLKRIYHFKGRGCYTEFCRCGLIKPRLNLNFGVSAPQRLRT